MDLSSRQISILKAVVEEYTETGEAVGSVTLEQKYKLGVSPATLRNEMAELERQGFLKQLHTSAGRIPTPIAIKFYVNELMKEQSLSVAEEVAVKERVWDHRFKQEDLLHADTKILAERSHSLCVASFGDDTYHSGYANLFIAPELFDIEVARNVLNLLDQNQALLTLFQRATGNQPIHLLVGQEMGFDFFDPVSCVFADLSIGGRKGTLGIIGPSRQEYDRNIPLVRYVANLVNQIAQEW